MPILKKYDLVVIGSGPSGQRAAVQAAKLKKTVLVIEKDSIGGSCLHRGTIPSKTLRELSLAKGEGEFSIFSSVMDRKREIIAEEATLIREQLVRNEVEYVDAVGSFASPTQIVVKTSDWADLITAQFVVIATGTRPHHPPEITFDSKVIFDSDSILNLTRKPERLAVVGAGVIGSEYASIFARLGIKVTLIDQRQQLLSWMDEEIIEALQRQFVANGIELVLGCQSDSIRPVEVDGQTKVAIRVEGKDLLFDALLNCTGRTGNTELLALEKAGLKADGRGLLSVNYYFQTDVPHIYAVGDVIGSPGLASASYEQGRLAASHAFGQYDGHFPESFPYGIYTIPEISSVGAQESHLRAKNIPYVVGRSRYRELARGKMLGDENGFLKLLFHAETHRLLGVQVIGTQATEIIHIGQAAYILGGDIDFFVNNVFNYPTLAEAYKVAAYHAYNQVRGTQGPKRTGASS